MQRLLNTTLAGIVACAGFAGSALANDTEADRAAALERLEEARIAFEAAKAELEAAQREAAAVTGGEIKGSTSAQSDDGVQPAEEADVPQDPSSWKDGWDWKAVVALTGASGNNENFSALASLSGERNTSKYETSLKLAYTYGTSDGTKNTSRGVLDLRNDWLTDSKWRYFADAKYEYDEFQSWDHRLSGHLGAGYEIIKDDKQELIGRLGFGGSYEFGGNADEHLIPEGLLGLDWKYQWTENTKLAASTTYYPSFDDFGEFRWNSNAGIEVVMDEESGMTLNAGIEHRHDSQPGTGKKPNDVLYFMGLGWSF
ncbi:MAG: DUF481 domain-containing protein [Phycisphaerales bacterium]|nr:DUF481 domain-containing protein [Phycisphaerales bacterium]